MVAPQSHEVFMGMLIAFVCVFIRYVCACTGNVFSVCVCTPMTRRRVCHALNARLMQSDATARELTPEKGSVSLQTLPSSALSSSPYSLLLLLSQVYKCAGLARLGKGRERERVFACVCVRPFRRPAARANKRLSVDTVRAFGLLVMVICHGLSGRAP